MKQRLIEGSGSLKQINNILSELSITKIFIVTGKNSFTKSGASQKLSSLLSNVEHLIFSEFSPNPKIEDLNKGLNLYRSWSPDLVLAIGGGSSIDMAKLINFFGNNDFTPQEFVFNSNTDFKINRPKSLIAVPTTSGTGSEATHFAVLYIDKVKYSVAHPYLLPEFVIIDPELMLSMPQYVIASTGMDALGQAIESYWNVNATEESKQYAAEAIKLILRNLISAVHHPSVASLSQMARAAFLSGQAINITRTTAPHAVSYPLTTYFNIAHGHAVSLTLSPFLSYNYSVTEDDLLDTRGVSYVKNTIKELFHLLEADNLEKAQRTIEGLIDKIGLERKLSKLGIKTEHDIDLIVKNGFNPERIVNNPRKIISEQLKKLLKSIW